MRHFFSFAPLLLAIAACSSSSSDSPPPAGAPPPVSTDTPPAPAVHGTFHFFADRNGASTPVDKIVYTEVFEVKLDGLPPGAVVDLTTKTYSPAGKGLGYSSTVTFTADASGAIDTKTMAPTKGAYSGVDPDGIIWSMAPVALAEGLGPDRAAAFFHAEIGGKTVADASLGRLITGATVKTTQVTDDGLVGIYYAPAGVTDKVPVVAFGGSEGGIGGGEFYAARIASWGYPALGLAYFGAPGVPNELDNVPLEYFQKAFQWLDKQGETRKGKAVVLGGSRGGELALLLGATFPEVVGVMADTPSYYRWAGLSANGDAAWTYQGKPLPFLTAGSATDLPPTVTTPDGQEAWVLVSMFQKALATTPADTLEAARTTVETTKGPVLMFGGDDDKMWPACDFIDRAMKKLTDSGHAAQYGDDSVCFKGAGHAVGQVGLPTTDSMWATEGLDTYALGGTAEGNGHSGRPAEVKMKALLERVSK